MNGNKLNARLGLIGLFVLVGLGIAVLMAFMPAGASTTGDVYPGYGDWQVGNATRVIDEDITVFGNINVTSTLELWNATIRMDLAIDNQYLINVTPTGNLKANDTWLTSTRDTREWGFLVYGMMTMLRTVVEETYDGIQVLTDNTVLIEDSSIILFTGIGLYLENADGTTVRNIQLQTNEYSGTSKGTYNATSSADYQVRASMNAGGGVVFVKGGKPTLDGIYASVNGTMILDLTLNKNPPGYYYIYLYLNTYVSVVAIDSQEMETISNIHVRDSTVTVHFDVDCYKYHNAGGNYDNYAYFYMYPTTFLTAVNVLNYRDVELKDCTLDNVNLKITSFMELKYGSYSYISLYFYSQGTGSAMFGATVDKEFVDEGPHDFKLTIKDATFDGNLLGWSFSPKYSGTVEPVFRSEILIENIKVNKGNTIFSFGISPQFQMAKTIYSNILIKDSAFPNLTGPLYTQSRSPGGAANPLVRNFELHDTLTVKDCTFFQSRSTYGLIYQQSGTSYRYDTANEYDLTNEFVGCEITNCSGNYGIGYYWGSPYLTEGRERIIFRDNLFANNTGSMVGYLYYFDTIYFINNTFIDNKYTSYLYMYDMGGYTTGKLPCDFKINDNTFINTEGGSGTYGFFYIYVGGDLQVMNNNISDMTTNLMFIYPITNYAGYADIHISGNEYTNVSGNIFYGQFYMYYGNVNVWIEDNYGHNTTGLLMEYNRQYAEQYDTTPTFVVHNNTFEGYAGRVLNLYGRLTITENTFIDCKGYALYVEYISQAAPVINDNKFIRCRDLYYLSATDKGVLKVSISMADFDVNCTGNAFYFKNIDATLSNITISDYVDVAIIAEDAIVDVTHSTIPIGSGLVITTGEINIWYEFELWAEWANSLDPTNSSGVPVQDALVVLYGSSGAYYSSSYTDVDGHVDTILVPQWSMLGSFLTVWTPYDVTVTQSGITQTNSFDLSSDLSGPDALTMLLVDSSIPVIRITSPFSGNLFSAEELTMRGFSTEIGSGLESIWVVVGDGEWVKVDVDLNGDFTHTITDLPEGANIPIKAKAYDTAKNMNETMITVTIDRTAPRLVIFEPEDGTIVSEVDIMILGEYETDAFITINGLERPGTSGTLSEAYTLSEGNNTIVVVATDIAGNAAMETRTVRLDRFSPTLTVLAPRDGLITRVTNISVEGDVELGSDITISVYRTNTDTIDEVITPKPDGTFTHKIDMEEGENVIVVSANDNAMNPTSVTRRVFVDTKAPLCTITSPEEGTVTSDNTIRVTGSAEVEGITLYLNGKQIFNDGTVDRYINLNEGTNVITLRAIDPIGNEFDDFVTVYLDTQAPMIEPIRPRAQYLMTNQADLIVQAAVFENRDLVSITVMGNEVTWSPVTGEENTYQFETTVTLTKQGENDVLVVAYDDAGNAATYTITVDFSTVKPMLFLVFSPSHPNIEGENANFHITGTTSAGIEEVRVIQTTTKVESARVPVAEDGTFSVVRTLVNGENSFSVSVTDAYGNTNATSEYSVNYVYKEKKDDDIQEPGIGPETWALWILVIAIALFITAVVVTRMLRREQD